MTPLGELNPTGRFSDRVTDYVKYRPSYPAPAIDAVLAGLRSPSDLTAADVGAGTGISARLLADRGVRVLAVEPNAAMSGAADQHAGVTWRTGTAEATGLADSSTDLITAFQAFHWFEPGPTLREFHRILRPGGRLALVWNRRSLTEPFTAGFRRAIHEVGGESAAERMDFDPAVIARSGLFSPPRLSEFPNEQRLDEAGLIGRAMSASYVPKTGPEAGRLLALLRELHARHADASGRVTLVYSTQVFVSARP